MTGEPLLSSSARPSSLSESMVMVRGVFAIASMSPCPKVYPQARLSHDPITRNRMTSPALASQCNETDTRCDFGSEPARRQDDTPGGEARGVCVWCGLD